VGGTGKRSAVFKEFLDSEPQENRSTNEKTGVSERKKEKSQGIGAGERKAWRREKLNHKRAPIRWKQGPV